MKKFFTSIALLLSVAAAAQAQSAAASQVRDDQLLNINASIRAQVRTLADSAMRAGLPVEAVLDDARKYSRNGRDPQQIMVVLRQLVGRLGAARTALGTAATPMDITAGALALRQGVPASTLAEFRRERAEQPMYVSLGVMAEIIGDGVPVDTAVSIMRRFIVADVRDADITAYRQNVQADIALGALPGVSASTRAAVTITQRAGQMFNGIREDLPRPAGKIPPE